MRAARTRAVCLTASVTEILGGSITFTQIVPSFKAIQKEGESGRRKINKWSRMGAIPLAVFQAWGIATALQAGGAKVHVIGGADEARELDAKRAIDQGTRLAASL